MVPVLAPQGTAPVQAATAGDTVDLRLLFIGAPTGATDPNTAAWAAGLTSQGVAFTEVDATGSLGSASISLPALTSSPTHGLYDGVVLAGKPADFGAGQLSALFGYESTFGIRQLDGDFVPDGTVGLSGVTDADSGTLISGTTATLTAPGLTTFASLNGPVPFDAGSFASPGTVASGLPTGATETPLLNDAAANVLIGVYQHPPTGDAQPNVQEMTLGFSYNPNMTQWLLLGPDLIDWVTGGAHVGLHRNYASIHVDDVLTPDDPWSTTTHANDFAATPLRMNPVDVDTAAAWERSNNFRLDMLFNWQGTDAVQQASVTDPLLAEFQKTDPANGKSYSSDFGWLNHTYDHAYLDAGCAPLNYIQAELNENVNKATAPKGATAGTGGLALPLSSDPAQALGTLDPHTFVPGGHSGLANLVPGAAGAVDPPNIETAVASTGGNIPSGSYQYAVTDQFNGADATAADESSASVTDPLNVPANGKVTITFPAVCHAGNYRVYREQVGAATWSFVGNLSTPPSSTLPDAQFGNPTSLTDVTNGGPLTQTFVDTAASGTSAFTTPPTTENALEQPWEQNQYFTAALTAAGITAVGADASKPYPNPADNQFGIGVPAPTTVFPAAAPFPISNTAGAAQAVPRHPTNIFYNNSTEAQALDEYNTLYVDVAGGGECVDTLVTTCLTEPATLSDIVDSVVTGMFANVVNNDPRPTFVHQSNIMGTAPATIPVTPPNTSTAVGDGLLYSVLNPLLAKYHTYFNATVPYQQPTMGAIGSILGQQSAWATAQPAGTASSANTVAASQVDGTITVTNNGAGAVTVPVTSPLGYSVVDPITLNSTPFGTQYGSTRSAWETLAPGASITISAAPPAVTSAATADPEVGSPFTFAVTTSGTLSLTLTATGALPSGLTFTPGAVGSGTGTISGTPAVGTGGTYPITLTATNIAGTGAQAFSLFVGEPKISVAASTNPPSFAVAGTPLTANYLVTNTGNVTLVGIGVADTLPGLSSVSCPESTLLVGVSETCTALYAAMQADVDTGGFNLAATASGTALSSTVVHGTSNATTPAVQGPAIAVTPSSHPASFFGAGTPLAFNYLVTNSGNVTLHGIGVSDPRTGLSAITCPNPMLAPAATESCTATYTTTAANVKAKGIHGTATASGTPPTGPAVTGKFAVVVPFWSEPLITSAKLTTVPRQTQVKFSFTASGLPAPALTLKGALPTGVTFNSTTGKLTGIVNAVGTYPLTLTATSLAGTTHRSYRLHVTAPQLASGVAAQPGNQKATVKWTAPAVRDGLPVTGYVVTPYVGHTALRSRTFHSTAKHQAINSLDNGHVYTFKVAAMNRLGTGPSAPASPAIKIGAATAPAVVTATATAIHPGSLLIRFSAASGNGSPVTGYLAVCVSRNGGGARSARGNGDQVSVVVQNVTIGKTYMCTVTATNKRGTGPPATSNRLVV